MTSWPPKVALITGAGSGLGFQLAKMLAAEGVAIAALDINESGLQSLHQELTANQARCSGAVADVTDAAALQGTVDALEQQVGPVDLLIASAGIGQESSAFAFDAAAFASTIQVNLIGVANSIAAVLPGMLRRGRGHLAAISSLASFRGLPSMAAYCASKSGVNALMESLRVELEPRGVFTTTICPGWVRTPMTSKLKLPIPQMLEVADAAQRILKALRQRRKVVAFPAGDARKVRWLRWLPPGISDWMVVRMMRALARQREPALPGRK